MPISSLPSPYGIGTFGKAAYDFADFLHAAGTALLAASAARPHKLRRLAVSELFAPLRATRTSSTSICCVEDGLLTREEVDRLRVGTRSRATWTTAKFTRAASPLLERAKVRGWERDREAVAAFESENSRWLPDYALCTWRSSGISACSSWTEWPDEGARLRRAGARSSSYRAELREDVELFTYHSVSLLPAVERAARATSTVSDIQHHRRPPHLCGRWTPPTCGAEPEKFQLDEPERAR